MAVAVSVMAALALTASSSEIVRVVQSRTYPLPGSVVDVGVLDDERFLLLSAQSAHLARLDAAGLVMLSECRLPESNKRVRAEAGLIRLSEDRSSAWLHSNRAARALLVSIEGDLLSARMEAEALPWQDSVNGVAFKEGTNLLEASIRLFGDGPFLLLASFDRSFAVMNDGRLKVAGPGEGHLIEGILVGPALAPLWEGHLAAASAQPPSATDQVLVLAPDGPGYRVAQSLSIEGAVRSLGSQVRSATAARLVVVAVSSKGMSQLGVIDLRYSPNR